MATTGTPIPNPSAARDLVFISYSHHDRDWLDHLRIFLKPYTRENLRIWADPYIEVGGDWRRDISSALSRSCVGVLHLSPEFLASDFIYSEELPPLLEGADAGAIILVLIPVRASNYEATPLAKLQFAHPPDRPLERLRRHERSAAFVEIVKKIAAAAQKAGTDLAAPPDHLVEASAAAEAAGFVEGGYPPPTRPSELRKRHFPQALRQRRRSIRSGRGARSRRPRAGAGGSD
jgi:TIR domain